MIHSVFTRFQPVKSGDWPQDASSEEWKFNFAGVRQRRSFTQGFDSQLQISGEAIYSSLEEIPPVGEEYFEWVAVLRSIEEAQNEFRMAELGAGFGRWAVNAAVAVRRYKPMPVHLIAVEAEPTHFDWIATHLRDNGLDPDKQTLINAAVTDREGEVQFQVGDPDQWYGQHISAPTGLIAASSSHVPSFWKHPRSYVLNRFPWIWLWLTSEGRAQRKESRDKGIQTRSVQAVTLESVLAPHPFIDLIHMDIQGAELEVCRSSMELLGAKVSRVHVATHSVEAEEGVRALFVKHGWQCEANYAGAGTRETPYGVGKFGDGVQTWSNTDLSNRARKEVSTHE